MMKVREIVLRSAFFGSLALMTGCAVKRDLVSAGAIKPELLASKAYSLSTPTVREDGDDLVVYGTVQRRDFAPLRLGRAAHVHVSLLDASGQVVAKTTASCSAPPGRGSPRSPGPRSASYRAKLASPPTTRGTVRVAVDSERHADSDEG